MIKTAAENLDKTGLNNIHLVLCDSEKLPIAGVSIDVMTNRHSFFNAEEVSRILKPSGTFVTQQVSEGDKRNFKAVFGRGQSFEVKSGTLKKTYLKKLRQAGIQVIEEKTVNTIEYYQSTNDVIFLLANTPIIPNFHFEKE